MTIEDELKETSVPQRSELEGVAKELFSDRDQLSADQKTKLSEEERSLCWLNQAIFNIIEMEELDKTSEFKRLSSSVDGWKTEAFVRTAQGTQELRTGFGGRMMNRLFGRQNE